MRTHRKILSVLALSSLFAASTAVASVERDYSESWQMDSDSKIRLQNINGAVEVEGWDRNEVQLDYRITADDEDDLQRVKVDIDQSSDSLDVEVDYEDNNSSWWGRGNNSGSVSFSLKVPRGAVLQDISSVNGGIEIRGVTNRIKTETVNGSIEVAGAANDLSASSVNGSVVVNFTRMGGSQRASIETVNGRIKVQIPSDSNVTVDAETVHGSIKNDFGLKAEKGFIGNDLRGAIGNGDANISLETVNGSISINN